MDLIKILCTYLVIAIIWSLYQGARGVVETRLGNTDKKWSTWQKVLVLDIHDFAFRAVCTLAGFLALLAAYRTAQGIHSIAQISTGNATFMILSFLIGTIGVGGQLHYVVLFGKWPR